MNKKSRINIPEQKIEDFCTSHHILKMSLFGSALTDRFNKDSDVDFLVEFEPSYIPSFFDLADMQFELEELLERKVDLRTPNDLSPYFRHQVLEKAKRLYG